MPSRINGGRIFPNTTKSTTEKAWDRIRNRAGINDLRIHDLRHTLASWMVGQGYSLPLIGKALNHATTLTTERYAHVDLNPVREAIERTSRLIVEAGSSGLTPVGDPTSQRELDAGKGKMAAGADGR